MTVFKIKSNIKMEIKLVNKIHLTHTGVQHSQNYASDVKEGNAHLFLGWLNFFGEGVEHTRSTM